jgi:hypothetical protein
MNSLRKADNPDLPKKKKNCYEIQRNEKRMKNLVDSSKGRL